MHTARVTALLKSLARGGGARGRSGDARPYAKIALGAGAASVATMCSRPDNSVCCDGEKTDRLKRWHNKWDANDTRWHLQHVNPQLQRYLHDLLPPPATPPPTGMGPRVLVPLCGKDVCMAFLARKGFRVLGIEGVRKAIDEFAEEHGVMGHSVAINLPPSINPDVLRGHAVLVGAGEGEPTRSESPPPVIFIQGDLFEIGPAEVQVLVPCDAGFDRGSLVAIPPDTRQKYARIISDFIRPEGRLLLVTVEHDVFSDGNFGPPFEVTEADVNALFGDDFDVRVLSRENVFEKEPMWRNRGCTRANECVYLLTKRAAAVKANL